MRCTVKVACACELAIVFFFCSFFAKLLKLPQSYVWLPPQRELKINRIHNSYGIDPGSARVDPAASQHALITVSPTGRAPLHSGHADHCLSCQTCVFCHLFLPTGCRMRIFSWNTVFSFSLLFFFFQTITCDLRIAISPPAFLTRIPANNNTAWLFSVSVDLAPPIGGYKVWKVESFIARRTKCNGILKWLLHR